MPWGIDFKADVSLLREHYRTIQEVQDAINTEELSLQEYKERILMLIAANPKDLVQPDEFVLWELHTQFTDMWTEILELNTKIYKLNLYLEYVKEHGIINPFDDGQ